MTANWTNDSHRKFLERVRTNRPKVRSEIEEHIAEALALLDNYKVFELLAYVFMNNGLADEGSYSEAHQEGCFGFVEYAISLALAKPHNPSAQERPTKDKLERFLYLVEHIYKSAWHYHSSEIVEGKYAHGEQYLRTSTMMRHMFLRGDSYPTHHKELFISLFEPHNEFLLKSFGFDALSFLKNSEEIELQVQAALHRCVEAHKLLIKLHQKFVEFADSHDLGDLDLEDVFATFNNLPEVELLNSELQNFSTHQDIGIFEVAPNANTPMPLLDLLSAHFGDNAQYIDQTPSGWPLNPSVFKTRPLIKDNGKYYCFAPQSLHYNLPDILEDLIKQASSVYFNETFQKRRGKVLEDLSANYLRASNKSHSRN
ncbi:MAG: hypothetical protein IT366_23345 [Candidatus Hydrogenedentes bacterium]|nr:hypothetical protein [Candidatus Hydrogenedentota bacterium]